MGLEEPVGVLATMNRAHALRAFGAFAGPYAVLGADAPLGKIVVGPGGTGIAGRARRRWILKPKLGL